MCGARSRTTFAATAAALLVWAALVVWPASVHAQQPGNVAIGRYDPPERGSDWFVGDSLDLRGKVRPAFGVSVDGGYRVIVLQKGSTTQSLLRDVVTMHAGGALVLADRFRFGVDLPIVVFQDSGAPPFTLAGTTYATPAEQALGDLRLGGDVRILGTYGSRTRFADALQLAAGMQVFLPTGSRADWASDGRVRFAPRVLAAIDAGPFAFAARMGFMFGRNEDWVFGSKWGQEMHWALSAGVRLLDRKLLVGPELWWSTTILSNPPLPRPPNANEGSQSPLEWLFGAHYAVGPVRLGAGIGTGISHDLGVPQVRWLARVEYAPERPVDGDGDGVPDTVDRCPTVPGVAKNGGCPADTDQDGVPDSQDACPDVPGPASLHGCPPDDDRDGIPDDADRCPYLAGVRENGGCPADRDKDGVWDDVDACPDVSGPRTNKGCPPDADGDGVPDALDACPDKKGVRSPKKEFDGCPADIDGDGVPNDADACPREPGRRVSDPKLDGCPVPQLAATIAFAAGSADIDKTFPAAALEAIVETLKTHPEIRKVVVEGHADKAEANAQALGTKRADAVAKWLTGKGVPKERIESASLGATKPLDEGKTEEGRRKNRRVELRSEP